ncbi:MAG: hypothetical protein KC449_29340, partial [Anaerolineales bacterium]|nr:hypothetical protein [Anaerolineales bacterium]
MAIGLAWYLGLNPSQVNTAVPTLDFESTERFTFSLNPSQRVLRINNWSRLIGAKRSTSGTRCLKNSTGLKTGIVFRDTYDPRSSTGCRQWCQLFFWYRFVKMVSFFSRLSLSKRILTKKGDTNEY